VNGINTVVVRGIEPGAFSGERIGYFMAFPESFLDELIRRSDIADVVGSYVSLTKRSGSNMFGLCPFHSEKTPSFSVSSDKQIYHCFGCGKGGGVINFMMEIENLPYPDAVAALAKRAGLQVPDDSVPEEIHSRRARMLELNKDAARFFYDVLLTPQGAEAVSYIAQRGISKGMVKRFGLGAAPDSWSALVDAMTRKGYNRQELIDAGLVKLSKKESAGIYDTFRNRLMFPVIDVRGNIIGFSGRILGDGEPKYLNSPDTLVFNKSRNIFALNLAKKSKLGMLILTEGNIDVVALHQAGFDCAVASLGTALTEEQIRLMSRYTQNIVIAYDSDDAGVHASQRAIGLLERTGLNVKVLRMNGAKDPDEFIKKYGADAFRLLIERSENHIEYRLLSIKAKYDLSTDEGRLHYLTEATEMLSKIDSSVEREIYGIKVSEAAGISAEAVKNEIKKAFSRRMSKAKKKQERENLSPSAKIQPADRAMRYENVYSAAAEEGVIRLLVMDPTLFRVAESFGLTEEDFTSPFLKKTYGLLVKRRNEDAEISPAALTAVMENAEASQFSVVIQKPESLPNGEKAMRDYIEKIRTERLKKNAKADPLAVLQKYREKTGYGG
jgi:DNA primase